MKAKPPTIVGEVNTAGFEEREEQLQLRLLCGKGDFIWRVQMPSGEVYDARMRLAEILRMLSTMLTEIASASERGK